MKVSFVAVSLLISAVALPSLHAQALVGIPFTFDDLTVDPGGAWAAGGEADEISFSALNAPNTAISQFALTSVDNYVSGLDFTLSGVFEVTSNAVSTATGTAPTMSVFAFTLFGDKTNASTGLFASLVISEGRGSYNGGQRLGLGFNRPTADVSYVGNLPGNGTATSGETFLTGSNTSLPNGSGATYNFEIDVSYVSASIVNVDFFVSNGTNSNTLSIDNIDISSIAANDVFGMTLSEQRRTLVGTFSDVTLTAVPEPAVYWLLSISLPFLVWLRRRRHA